MQLTPSPFQMIKDGLKTIELRLYDEKRRMIHESDTIEFVNTEGIHELLNIALTAVNNEEIERPKTIRDLIEQGYALEERKNAAQKPVTEEKKDEVIEEKQEERMMGGLSL